MMDNNNYGFIYITTNTINNKKYIGQKKYNSRDWKTYLGSGIRIKYAINKYGAENFTRKIIEDCRNQVELNEREIYWINYYDATKSEEFYNIASGGDGGNVISGYTNEQKILLSKKHSVSGKVGSLKGEDSPMSKLTNSQVKDIIKMLLENITLSDIARKYGVGISTISDILYKRTWRPLSENVKFNYTYENSFSNNKKQKMIDCYNLNGEFIKTYNSAREASKDIGCGYKMISSIALGNKRKWKIFIFRFHGEDFDKYETKNIHLIKVNKYDLNGNFIKSFNSIREANKDNGGRVDYALKSKSHKSNGYLWYKVGDISPKQKGN